jgi:hypothetical protein
MYYQLAPARTDFHRKLIECLACCFNDVPELARDAQSLTRPACDDKTRCCD